MIADYRPALRAVLLSDADILALVDQRIYPMILAQGDRGPSLVYQKISSVPDYSLAGPSKIAQIRVQIDSWAQNIDSATALADAVKNKLNGFAGEISYGDDSPQATLNFKGIFFDSEREDYDGVSRLYRISRDYFMYYLETV